jgi:hypothetical protein
MYFALHIDCGLQNVFTKGNYFVSFSFTIKGCNTPCNFVTKNYSLQFSQLNDEFVNPICFHLVYMSICVYGNVFVYCYKYLHITFSLWDHSLIKITYMLFHLLLDFWLAMLLNGLMVKLFVLMVATFCS